MNITVVNEGGNLVSHVRMDGAWIGGIDISINKADTSRAFDTSTKVSPNIRNRAVNSLGSMCQIMCA